MEKENDKNNGTGVSKLQNLIGKLSVHPRDGKVMIIGGVCQSTNNFSDFWAYRKIGPNGRPFGPTLWGFPWL